MKEKHIRVQLVVLLSVNNLHFAVARPKYLLVSTHHPVTIEAIGDVPFASSDYISGAQPKGLKQGIPMAPNFIIVATKWIVL